MFVVFQHIKKNSSLFAKLKEKKERVLVDFLAFAGRPRQKGGYLKKKKNARSS